MAIDEYGQIIRRSNRPNNNDDETSQENSVSKSDKLENLGGTKSDNSATPKENTSEEKNNKKVNTINPTLLQGIIGRKHKGY